jgi:5-methylcytosine-specific restriction endonuclease McrA
MQFYYTNRDYHIDGDISACNECQHILKRLRRKRLPKQDRIRRDTVIAEHAAYVQWQAQWRLWEEESRQQELIDELYKRFYGAVHNGRTRAAIKNAAVNDLTLDEWIGVLERWGNRCAYCGQSALPIGMDHVVPISKGGNHTASNVVPACKYCNGIKGVGDPLPFFNPPEGY